MLEKALNRIMAGAHTPEGKVIAILLAVSLALMTWNATSISYAFGKETEERSDAPTEIVVQADKSGASEKVAEATASQSAPSRADAATQPEAAPASADTATGDSKAGAAEDAEPAASEPAPATVDAASEDASSTAEEPAASANDEAAASEQALASAETASANEGTAADSSEGPAVASEPETALTEGEAIVDGESGEATANNAAFAENDEAAQGEEGAETKDALANGASEVKKVANDRAVQEDDGEVAEEAEKAEKARKAKFPAATLTDNGVVVTAPEGALPEGAKMKAVRIYNDQAVANAVEDQLSEDETVEEVVAYDVTLYDADGNEIQPRIPVSVTIAAATSLDGDTQMYHMDNLASNAEKVADGASASAEHFSIYAVVVVANPNSTAYEAAGGYFDIKIRYEDENQNIIPGIGASHYELTPGMTITVNQIIGDNQTITVGNKVYTFENAYFYWEGHYGGKKCYITSFTAGNQRNGEYQSNLFFNGSLYGNDGRVEQTSRWAYNPTGVLHLVYKTSTVPMYAVTYHSNYGTGETSSINVSRGSAVTAMSYEQAFGEVPRNYEFLGWATSEGDSVRYRAGSTVTQSARQSYDLYAVWKWTDGNVNVTYVADPATGGRLSASGEVLRLNHEPGKNPWWDNPNGSTASAAAGYTFLGWYKGDALVQSESELGLNAIWNNMNMEGDAYKDTTFTAKFEKNATISYVVDPAGGGSVWRASEAVSSKSLPQGSTATANSDDEYYFAGWYVGETRVAGANVPTLTQTVIDQYAKVDGKYVDTTFAAKFEKYQTLELVANSDSSRKYSGADETVTGYTGLPSGKQFSEDQLSKISASGTGKDAGEYDVMFADGAPATLTAIDGTVYKVTYKPGKLTIAKRSVTLASASGEKVYDGKALVKNAQADVTVGGDGWAAGEGATYAITGTQTDVGSSDNEFTYTLDEGTKASNYEIAEPVFGTLTVTKAAMDVAATDYEGKYDGAAHAGGATPSVVAGTTVHYSTDGSETWTATVPSITDAGTVSYKVKATNPNYEDAIDDGTLAVAKRDVTLVSASGEKEYDGDPLVKNAQTDITVGGDGWVAGEGASYSITGAQTVVGDSQNTFTYTLDENTKAGNYNVVTTFGTLKVTSRDEGHKPLLEIKAKSNSETIKYDGQEHSVPAELETDTYTIEGHTYTVEGLTVAGATGTDAGEYPSVVAGTPVIRDEGGNDVTSQFHVSVSGGKLTIEKRDVTLASANGEKEYDGTALVKNAQTDVTVGGDGWAEGEGATYSISGAQTLVGESENAFTYTLGANTKAGNYNVSMAFGTLKVTDRAEKYQVEIVAKSLVSPYDGTEQSVSGFETAEFTENGVTYEVNGLTSEAKATHVSDSIASIPVSGTPKVVIKGTTSDVTDQFSVKVTPGKLTIEPRKVTLASDNAEKHYDGKPLVRNAQENVKVAEGSWVPGDGATYAISGTQTIVGESANKFTYTLNEGISAEDYAVKTTFGTLKVTDRDHKFALTLKAASDRVRYDAEEHAVSGFEIDEAAGVVAGETSSSFTIDGVAFTLSGLSAEVSETNAGIYPNTFEGAALVKDADGNDVTGQFEIGYVPGTLDIYKATFDVTQPEDVVYNGLLQRRPVTVTDDETGAVLVRDRDFTITWSYAIDVAEVEVRVVGIGNYTNTVVRTYQITPAPLYISTLSAEKTYDGEALTADGEVSGFVNGETVSFATTGSQTEVGTSENTYSLVWDGTAKEANYRIADEALGELTVTPEPVVSHALTVMFVYEDGTQARATVTEMHQAGESYNVQTPVIDGFAAVDDAGAAISAIQGEMPDGDLVVTITYKSIADIVNPTPGTTDPDDPRNPDDPSEPSNPGTPSEPSDPNEPGNPGGNGDDGDNGGNDDNGDNPVSPASSNNTDDEGENPDNTNGTTNPNDESDDNSGVGGEGDDNGNAGNNGGGNVGDNGGATNGAGGTTDAGAGDGGANRGANRGGNATPTAAAATPAAPAAAVPAAAAPAAAAPAPATPAAAIAGPAADAAAIASGDAPAATVSIDDEGNPLVESIADDANALGEGVGAGSWSLFDVLCTALAAILCAVMLLGAIGRNRDEEERDGQEVEQEVKRRRILRIASLLPAIGAVVVLILTQDFTSQMVLFDMWSILFGIIGIAQIALMLLSRKDKEDLDEDLDKEGGAAPVTA